MEVVLLERAEDVGRLAADAIEALVRRAPGAVLGLATGSSPLPAYRELVSASPRRHRAGVRRGALRHPRRVRRAARRGTRRAIGRPMFRELTDALGIARERVMSPDPEPEGLPGAGERYEGLIEAAGGVDLQVLGIGADGHLAFNEPGSSLASRTRIKTLTERTRRDNARFFGSVDEVPRHVLTQGLGTILRARHLLLLAAGADKAHAVAAAVEGRSRRPARRRCSSCTRTRPCSSTPGGVAPGPT